VNLINTQFIGFISGTHEFQNVSVTSTMTGGITIGGSFIHGSNAIGILVIAYSLSNDSVIKYRYVPHLVTGLKSIMGLSIDEYNVSVFVVEGNRLPFNRSATRPRNVFIMREEAGIILCVISLCHKLLLTCTCRSKSESFG
jgi:hypothetical protein